MSTKVPDNIISDAIKLIQKSLERFGWPIIFSAAAIYYILPHIRSYLQKLSLASANNRHRRAIIQEDVKKVRVRQQLDVYKAAREANSHDSIYA